MRLLDLFCGAGGCSVGYARAGFEVVGVDIEPHPEYPFEFHQSDALHTLGNWLFLSAFDAIHASPPCQAFTTMSNRHRGLGGKTDDHPELIAAVRTLLRRTGKSYVIENVVGARSHMENPVLLHGGMFRLGVHRPRLFESDVLLLAAPATPAANPVGVYGKAHDGRLLFRRADGTEQHAAGSLEEAQTAMGIDWMDWDDLREAIPPAYTEHIGSQLMAHLAERAA